MYVYEARQLYGDLQDVVVPEMYLDKTTRRVLVMDWVEVFSVTFWSVCSMNTLLADGKFETTFTMKLFVDLWPYSWIC